MTQTLSRGPIRFGLPGNAAVLSDLHPVHPILSCLSTSAFCDIPAVSFTPHPRPPPSVLRSRQAAPDDLPTHSRCWPSPERHSLMTCKLPSSFFPSCCFPPVAFLSPVADPVSTPAASVAMLASDAHIYSV